MQQIEIRHVEPGDAAQMRDLYAQPHAVEGTLQLPFPALKSWEERVAQEMPNGKSLVAVCGDEVVGQIGFYANTRARRKHVGSFGMATKHGWQKRGVGSQLLAAVLDLADNWYNLKRVEIEVFTDNESAIALYKKHGFVIEGEAAAYAFKNGEYAAVYFMARVRD